MRNVEGAKAGSNQKKPYRAPVSVTSTQRMRIKYGISEGTIRGFSAEFSHNEMLKRIYLDGTPIMSAEGEQLLDVVVEFRDGSRDQEPINGLPSISVEHDVGVEVKVAAPVSRSFDRSDTTSYDVRISVPTLYQGDDEGNSNKGLIQFKIDVSTDGGAFEEAGRFEIYEKILNGFAETYNVVVPKGSNHVVRISRLNSEVVSDYSVNRLVVEAITENTDVRLRYTNTAVLYLEYDAEQFSNVPKLEMRVFGKNDILVPANYNGDTHTYATSGAGTTNGVWDGTWKRAYTDNPVWISLDLMISRRYGLGDKIDLTFINKWELYGLAQYCDEAVADGKGGFEPRFTCNNMYLQKSEDAYRVLKDLAASFRAKVVWDGEFITLQADVPRDPVHTFSNANASDITYSSTQDSAQRNLINVQYYDRDNKFASDVVMQRSNSNILSRGKVVDGNFTALGCASQGQAQRIASYVMNTELYETELVSFTTGLEGGLVRLNDVIQMADNSVAGQTVGGRIAAVNGRSITLDRKIPDNVQAIATTQLSINRQDVKNEPISIVSISDDRMTAVLASDAPAGTEAGLVWALLTQDLVPQKFVVTDIEFDSTNMTFAVSAIQYNESKYAAIDGSARIVVPPISVTEYKMLKAPIIVIASYLTRIIQDAVVCDIDVSWAQSTNAVQYQLEMQKAGSDWRIVGRFMSLATTLDNMYTGTYTFRVCAYDSLGNASQYTYSDPILVAGKVLPPPMLTQYNVIGILFGYQHKWIYPAHTEDSRAVRLRFTTTDPVASPAQEWQYVDVAYPTANFTEQDVTAHLRTWFSAAIVDKYGNVGAYTAWLSVVPSSNPAQVLDLLDGQLTAQQLDQDLINKIAIGTEAALAAEIAQNAADAAALAATNAQTAADQAKTAADGVIAKVNTEVLPQLNNLDVGLTQEITDRQDGDTHNLSELNAYKLSNDNAVSAAMQQATTAISTTEANATLIGAVQGQLTNLAGDVQQKADNSVVQQIDTRLTNLDGVVQANNSAVLLLQGRTTTLEGEITNTVKTEALQNYYTKQQANEATAGQISEFNASLVIGGTNLFSFTRAVAGFIDPNTGEVSSSTASHQSMNTLIPLGSHKSMTYQVWNPAAIQNTTNINRIAFFKADGSFLSVTALIGLNGTTYQTMLIQIPDAATHARLGVLAGPVSGARDESIKIKIEFGNKPTDWTPSVGDVQNNLDANANAIQTVTTEVARVNGEVVSTANSVSTLSSNVGLLQGSINEVRQTVTNNQESTNTLVTSLRSGMADADDVSMMMRNAAVVFEDLNFRDGYNGVGVYNNYENGALVSNFTDKLPDNPVASTRQLQFIHSGGATTPGLGGFHQTVLSRANGVFLVKFVAKLPVGYDFNLGANPYGDGANGYFIGSSEGTGKFKTYHAVYRCGATGSFSSIGFVYANGPQPTPENPLIWYLASSTVYDCLDSKVAPDSVVNGIAEAKSIASTAVNKSEATAVMAQNLQTSLDNTNANISNNYYTKSSTDEAISNQITNLSATLDMSVLPSKRDSTKANQWLLTHVVPKDAGWASHGVKPDFSTLKTGIKNKRIYCADGNTIFTGSEYDNTVLYFRTIVYVNTDVEVNLGDFTGDDAHSIYVNGVLNFTKGYYGSTANLRLALKTGLNTVDVICYNGGGAAGFFSNVLLSSLVVNMYAPESVEEQVAATANAVSSLTATVSNIDGVVSSQANQLTSLSAKLNERRLYQLYSGGLSSTTGGTGWLRGFDPDSHYGIGRSYGLVVFNDDGSIQSVNSYDVWSGNIQGFIDSVAAVPNGTYVAVLTSDEPQSNNFHIKDALKSLGGSDAIDQLVYRGAYLLVGRKGLPSGQAIEKVSNTTSFGVDYLLEMYNGVPIGLGGSSPQSDIVSNMRTEVSNIGGSITALAVETNTLSTTVGNNTAAIQLQQSSIDGINAKATLQVEAGGVVGGVALGNNGGVVDVLIRSNTFAIAPPVSAGAGDAGKYMFQYRATPVTLPNGHVSPAGAYLGRASIDYIDATQIYATELSAITANLGRFVSTDAGGSTEIAGKEIIVKDPNGNIRVHIGIFT